MNLIAKALLESKAVFIKPNPEDFFTWTSGKRSPIYCDNRQLLSYPIFRNLIIENFINHINENYPSVGTIAGTATAGIPWAAWIADKLDLPLIYIRSKPKGHGLRSAIEGKVEKGQNVLIIEDLISTGKSSIESAEHAKNEELNVLAVLSIFTYGFKLADDKFSDKKLKNHSLCNVDELLQYAKESKTLNDKNVETVLEWKNNF